jgi:hypothetical protein
MSIAKNRIFVVVLLEGCCLVSGALAQGPRQPKFFFQGAKTDIKPVRFGSTYKRGRFCKAYGKNFRNTWRYD